MLTLAVMSVVMFLSVLQLLHHMGYIEPPLRGITHVWNNPLLSVIEDTGTLKMLQNVQQDAEIQDSGILKPCLPEDEPKSPEINLSDTQAVGQAIESWYTPLIYVYYAWKSAVSAIPPMIVVAVIPVILYTIYSGIVIILYPPIEVDTHLQTLETFLDSSNKEIQTRASQTTEDLVKDVYENLELQESKALEIIKDILNEMNEGLTMQQWYEQQKLNYMMEDDLRAAELSSKHRRKTNDVNRSLRDLRHTTANRDDRLATLHDSQLRARSAYSRCMELLDELQGVRNSNVAIRVMDRQQDSSEMQVPSGID